MRTPAALLGWVSFGLSGGADLQSLDAPRESRGVRRVPAAPDQAQNIHPTPAVVSTVLRELLNLSTRLSM